MSEATTIAKGSFWTLTSTMLTKFISFIYTIIIARLLAPDDIGLFYLVLSIVGILYIFTDLGLIYSLSRYVPYFYGRKELGKLKSLVKLSYLGGGMLTLLFSTLVFFSSELISEIVGQPVMAPVLQMMSIWLFLKEIDDVNRGILTGRKRMKEAKGLDAVQNLAKLVITLIAFYIIGFNAEALSIGFLISFLLILPIGGYYVLDEMKGWEKTEKRQSMKEQMELGKEVVSFGLVITLITTLWSIIQYTDRIMIGYFAEDGLGGVAVYSIALGLANLVILFPTAITSIFFPVVSELYGRKDFEKMKETLATAMKWSIMLLTPFAIVMSVFGSELLVLFYGSVYEAGALVLAFFVIGLFIRSISMLPNDVLSAMRKLNVELKALGVAAVANIILNLALIPSWGINGAAFASFVSLIIISLMVFYYSKKIFNFSFPKEISKPLVGGVLTLLIILILKAGIISVIDASVDTVGGYALGEQVVGELVEKMIKFVIFGLLFLFAVLIYFIILFIMKAFGKTENEMLQKAMKRGKIPKKYADKTIKFFEKGCEEEQS